MSIQKTKVSIQRGDDFQEMDSLLSDAIAALDDRNARVSALLEAESNIALPNPEATLEGLEEAEPAVTSVEEGAAAPVEPEG